MCSSEQNVCICKLSVLCSHMTTVQKIQEYKFSYLALAFFFFKMMSLAKKKMFDHPILLYFFLYLLAIFL